MALDKIGDLAASLHQSRCLIYWLLGEYKIGVELENKK